MNTRASETPIPEAPVRPIVFDRSDPRAIALHAISDLFTQGGLRTLHSWRGDLWIWTGSHYSIMDVEAARATLYSFLERAISLDGSPLRPNTTLVNNVLDALRAAAHLESTVHAPAWLQPNTTPANDLLSVSNGLLSISTRRLIGHTAAFFNTSAIDCRYEPVAALPEAFLEFLAALWPDDDEAVCTLQEMFGYIVTGGLRLHKAFMIVGPKRAGKGTIGRVLKKLVGVHNTVVPTLTSLTTPFGLQPLIGKSLAIIPDARLSSRTDQAVIVERLLAITGEDGLTIDRKYQQPWFGQLPTRFVVLTNELPRIEDSSGAFASRFIVLRLTRSWFGAEDESLDDRLGEELPEILRWALEGFARLCERKRFSPPASSEEATRELENLGSPVGAFVREACVVEADAEIETAILYEAWTSWCNRHGRHPSNEQVFGRDLRAVIPEVCTASRRASGDRFRVYKGVQLRDTR